MDTKQILANYERSLSSSGKLRNHYIKIARSFLEYSGGVFDRPTINDYLEKIRTKNSFSDGTINFHFRIIRTMFNRNEVDFAKEGVTWPFRRGEAPVIREDKVNAPALDPEVVIEMIQAVKEKGSPDMAAYLAISTTYGLRREEIYQLKDEDIDLKSKTIHIATLKHGRERTHQLADEITPYLTAHKFEQGTTEFSILTTWYRIEYLIGMKHIDQVGWHSIRRTLNTLLLDALPQNVVESFLRWKQRTSSNMAYRYTAQKFVGREGSSSRVAKEFQDIDQKVFAAHPFLKYWKS